MENILCVIPARSGSQRIPRKNLSVIDGSTLVRRAYDVAMSSGVISHIIVSSDRKEMADGLNWIRRPDSLSGPSADISQAVKHAIQEVENKESIIFDYVVTLQPAIPVRTAEVVRLVIQGVIKHRCNGGLTGVPIVPWTWRETNGQAFNAWTPNPYPRSQEFHDTRMWQEINAVQVATRKVAIEGKRWDLPLLVHLLPSYAVIDIDDKRDLDRARASLGYILSALEKDPGEEQFVIKNINGHSKL